MKNTLFYSLFVSLFCISLQTSAQCDFPDSFSGNTGANMTVMLTPDLITSLNVTDSDAYVVALNPDGLVIGSAEVYGVTQTSLAVWGDDTETAEVDGALANENVSFQLVDGNILYDVVMPSSVSYSVNGLIAQTAAATLTFNCEQEIVACYLPTVFVGNTGANMTVMLTPGFINPLGVVNESAYIAAISASDIVVGSVSIYGLSQTTIAIWGDDTSTPELDGAIAGEAISFQLVDGANLSSLIFPTSVNYSGNGLSVQSSEPTVTFVCEAILGCTDSTALNYDPIATGDDGSCIAAVLGCTDFASPNYNENANTDDGSCVDFCSTWFTPFSEESQTVSSASVFLSEAYVLSLNAQSASAYIVGVTPNGLVVGSSLIGQVSQQLALWPTDPQTTEIDGAQDGELISFYLIDDENVYLLDYEYIFATNGFVSVSTEETPLLSCMANIPFGCTNNTACNFDASANTDDGTCTYANVNYDCNDVCINDTDSDGVCDELEIVGCQDVNACNFNAAATDSDDSCELPLAFYNCASECLLDSDNDGVCDELEVVGCQDETACDYNSLATDADECTYVVEFFNCENECLSDSDNDGICDELEIVGCQDIIACNYDEAATDAGTCEYATENYNCDEVCLNDSDLDGVCDEFEVVGCQDDTACNYNELATDSDDCTFVDGVCETCIDGLIVDNDSDEDSVCNIDEIIGCTDVEACNYDSNSTTDTDNSLCEYIDGCQECSGETDGSGIVLDIDPSICAFTIQETLSLVYDEVSLDNEVFVSNLISMLETQLDLPEGSVQIIEVIINEVRAFNVDVIYEIILTQEQIEALNLSPEQIAQNIEDDVNQLALVLENAGSSFDFVEGCTNYEANNFDVLANINDGSCEFTNPGCGVQGACNYNPELDAEYSDFNLCVFTEVNHFCADSLIGDSTVYYDGGCTNDVNADGICDEVQELGCTQENAFNYSATAVLDDGSCIDKVFGCIDVTACNLNTEANTNDDSCEFPAEYYDCLQNCLVDSDNDGICNALEIAGCTNPIASNYNPLATDNDFSCEVVEACGDANYLEYSFNADLINNNLCITLIIQGCTDVAACNYDPLANTSLVVYDSLGVYLGSSCIEPQSYYNCNGDCNSDLDFDGICDENEIVGCLDSSACNYNALATDSGDCTFASENYDCEDVCLNDVNQNGVCDELELAGCIDQNACNYSELATITDTLYCEYPMADYLNCQGDCIDDVDADGICDAQEVNGCTNTFATNYNQYATNSIESLCEFISGCTDPSMFNYNPLAVVENNTTCIPFVQGCLDPLYLEYNVLANQSNGSCSQLIVYGCDDTEAVNYNAYVNTVDYSCQYSVVVGCMDSTYLNFSPTATLQDPSMCGDLIVYGCTNSEYLEYNPQATVENGTCLEYPYEGCTDENFLEYNIYYNTPLAGACVTLHIVGCMNSDAYNYNPDATVYIEEEDPCILFGCTNDTYAEYYTQGYVATNSLAGSCIQTVVFGCTSPIAFAGSYNSLANVNQVSAENTDSPCIYNSGEVVNFEANNTGNNMSVLIPYALVLSGDFASIDDIPNGTQIGAFYSTSNQLYCGGFDVWNPEEDLANNIENIGVVIYGDDELTPIVDGFVMGESMQWMLLTPDGLLYSVSPVYNTSLSSGTGSGNSFSIDAYSVMIHMDITFMYQMPIVGCRNSMFLDYNPNASVDGIGGFDNGLPFQDFMNNETFVAIPDSLDDDNMYDLNGDGQANPGCFVLSSYGCMNTLALNYNASATISDDSCIPIIEGCLDESAFNYILPVGNENVDVNIHKPETCIPKIMGCLSDVYAFNYIAPIGDPNIDVNTAVQCIPVIEGCTDPLAFNYNFIVSEAAIIIATGNPFTTANTEFAPSVCIPRVYGCTDVNAFNYNEAANTNSIHFETGASTCYPVIEGCTDVTAINFQVDVNNQFIDINTPADSLCIFEIEGCTEPTALNYNAQANSDDNSCIDKVYGCTDATQINYNPLANVMFEGACIPVIYGCINDLTAFNYVFPLGNPYVDVNTLSECIPVVEGCTDVNAHANSYSIIANTDDGSCYYTPGCTNDSYLAYWTQGFTSDYNDGSCNEELVEFYCSDEWYLEYFSEPVFGSEISTGNFAHISACQNELITYCNDNSSISYFPTSNVADGNSQQVLNGNFASSESDVCIDVQIQAFCNDSNYSEYYGQNNSVAGNNAKEDGGNIIDNALCVSPVDFYCDDSNSIAYYAFDENLNDFSVLLIDTGNVLDVSLCGIQISPYCNDAQNTSYYNTANVSGGLASVNTNIIDNTFCTGDSVIFYCNDATKIGYYNIEANSVSGSQEQFVGTIIHDELVCAEDVIRYCNDTNYVEYYSELASLISVDTELWNLVDYSLCSTEIVFGCMDTVMFNYSVTANVDGFDFDNLVSSCYPVKEGCTDVTAFNYNDYDNNGSQNVYNTVDSTVNINTHIQELCVPIIEGCLSDPSAFNYPIFTGNPQTDVNTNNTDLCIDVVIGCMDATAFNYNEEANTPHESSCEPVVIGCMDSEAFNFNLLANTADNCIDIVYGCTNSIALNFYANANTDDANCIDVVFGCNDNGSLFSDLVINTTGELGQDGIDDDYQWDLDSDGLPAFNYYEQATFTLNCVAIQPGCINPIAFNFNPQANTSDASCIAVIEGCTDINAFNYNFNANTEFIPSNCEQGIVGCLDQNALTYNCTNGDYPICYPNCTTEDDLFCEDSGVNIHNQNSCLSIIAGCTDYTSINYIPGLNPNVDNGTCVPIVFGCTEVNAINYNSNANANDYSCHTAIEGCIDNGQPFLDVYNNISGEEIPDGIDDDYQYDIDEDGLQALNYSPNSNQYNYSGPDYEFACVQKIFGCTNEFAINYNIEATISNGSCISEVVGCIDNGQVFLDEFNNITGEEGADDVDDDYQWDIDNDGVQALNYNPSANTNNGSCIALTYGCMIETAYNYNPNATISDASCMAVIIGCTTTTSLNFNPLANTEDGSCIEIIYGCLSEFAINFDANATVADGSCIAIVNGCIDSNALNYNTNANTDDGSCVIIVYGCMNEVATNYNANATVADGSCVQEVVGCTVSGSLNYNPEATTNDNSCVEAIQGCMNSLAFNYNLNANVADGSCEPEIAGCMDQDALNFNASANIENGSCVDMVEGCNIPTMSNYNELANFNDGSCIPAVYGCTDVNAFNYTSNANTELDPSTCVDIVYGCMLNLPFICNFNSLANVDDNSCEASSCAGRASLRAFASPVCVDPISENYFALLDSITPSTEWATSYFNPEAENFQAAWVNQYYIDNNTCTYIAGCTDITMFGYNPNATFDDGSCTPYVYGCMDIEYVEYNENVNTSDNSCNTIKVFGCNDVNSFNYDNLVTVLGVDANNDFVADYFENELINPCTEIIYGCTDADYVEYWDSFDTIANSLVAVSPLPNTQYYNTEGESLSCINLLTLGCTNSEYLNYWTLDNDLQINAPVPVPNIDNGSCTDLLVLGCLNSEFLEYNATANADQFISIEIPSMCITPKVDGCTSPDYMEYNNLANNDDGSCEVLIVYGCIDSTYVEYWQFVEDTETGIFELFNPVNTPNTNDGSCSIEIVSGCNITTAENYYLDSPELTNTVNVLDNSICSGIVGCMNINASNYDPLAVTQGDCAGCTNTNALNWNDWATIDDGSCEVLGCTDNGLAIVDDYNNDTNELGADGLDDDGIYDLDGDGAASANYNPEATINDFSCLATILEGCTDPLAFNYCEACNVNDDSCIPVITGCTDSLYVEYYDWTYSADTSYQITPLEIVANTDDGSCSHVIVEGCTIFEYLEFSAGADVYDSNACITPKVYGCLDPLYLESLDGDFNATVYDTIPATQFHVDNGIATELGEDVVVDLFCFTFEVDGCMDANYIEYNEYATVDDGTCSELIVEGCTELLSVNYNANANVDDGSCIPIVEGCTDQFAFNYNVLANTNDGSCIEIIFGCPDPTYLEHYNYNALTFLLDALPDSIAFNTDAYTGASYCQTPIIEGCADAAYIEYYDYNSTDFSVTYKVDIANVDDGSCSTPRLDGCVDDSYLEYTSNTNVHLDGACVVLKIEGCTDQAFLEYWDYDSINFELNEPNITVNFDNGSCITPISIGCLNAFADNYLDYLGLANVHDVGLCTGGFGCLLPQYLDYNESYIGHNQDMCTAFKVFGCIDETAYNFDSSANINGVDTLGGFDFFPDTNTDGIVIDPCYPVIAGCMDSTSFNFTTLIGDDMVDVNTEDLSCYPIIEGCTDATSFNFIALTNDVHIDVNTDDNSCFPVKEGCLDLDAYNYNDWSGDGVADVFVSAESQNINTHVESMCIAKIFGCMDTTMFNYTELANTQETSLDDATSPCIEFSYGCIDATMFNFDVNANTNQVSYLDLNDPCYAIIYGCLDNLADNYIQPISDSLVDINTEDGTCEYFGCMNYTAINFDSNANVNDGSCIISGCIIDFYPNYNPAATHDDGSCSYSIYEIYGCIDSTYLEYYVYNETELSISEADQVVTLDNGTCITPIIVGCNIPSMFNYEPTVNVYDQTTCIEVVLGCTDDSFVEYWSYDVSSMTLSSPLELANTDDGSCSTTIVFGCTLQGNDQYEELANVYDTLACLVEGCMDPNYLEFNLAVTLANVDFCITPVLEGCTDSAFIEYYNIEAYNAETETYLLSNKEILPNTNDGTCENEIVTGCYYQDFVNYNASVNVYNFYDVPNSYEEGTTILDLCGDALVVGCTDSDAYNYDPTANVEALCIYSGCTLPFAFNYDENADIDDGSCIPFIEGCTVSSFLNFNPEANIDDGSCSNSPIIYGCTDSLYFEYNSLATHNAIPTDCITLHIVGCMDVNAATWNPLATIHDNSLCTYEIISGCTSNFYLEYNVLATISDPLACITPVVEGCTIENSTNYDATANLDDGSCIEEILGCTDAQYLEYWDYDAELMTVSSLVQAANTNTIPSSCINTIYTGCTDSTFVEYYNYTQVSGYFYLNGVNSDINLSQPSACINTVVNGCIYDTFIEFNPAANVFTLNDCVYIIDNVCTDPLADDYQEASLINSTYSAGGSSYIYQEENSLCNYTGCMNNAFIEYQEYYTVPDQDACLTHKVVGCTDLSYVDSYVDNVYDPESGMIVIGELNPYINYSDNSHCITPIIEGCTIWYYSEYNPLTNVESNSLCLEPAIYGCSDSLADNYNPAANFVEDGILNYNDNNCDYLGCTNSDFIEYWNYDLATQQISTPIRISNVDDGSCTTSIVFGCTDSEMFNFDSTSNVNQTSWEDETSSCNEEVVGCMNELYVGFNPLANIESGLCSVLVVSGCTNSLAINYNPLANTNDASCIDKEQGCADNGLAFEDLLNNLTGLLGSDGVDDDYQYDYDFDGMAAFNYDSTANVNVLCEAVVYGCIDGGMSNYSSSANTDDGSCIPVIEGCLDEDFYNYNDYDYDGAPNELTNDPFIDINTNNPIYCEQLQLGCIDNNAIEIDGTPVADNLDANANTDNGSCIYFGCMDVEADNYEVWATNTGTINNCLYYGCTNQNSFNYDDQANYNDGSCIAIVEGCVNTSFVEYWDFDPLSNTISQPEAAPNVNNGSCLTFIVFGCTNASATNYNASAIVNQVSFEDESTPCVPYVFGCTIDSMFNYNPIANTDDGSCIEIVEGCMNPLAINYNPDANISVNCILPIYGCTDETAFNFNSDAQEDDGSCIPVIEGCVNPFALNYNPNANTNNGSCVAFVGGCMDSTALNYSSFATFDSGNCIEAIPGCTNIYANNYNPTANQFDGSCTYGIETVFGCTVSMASNYNPLATDDDGSCEFDFGGRTVADTICIDPLAVNVHPLVDYPTALAAYIADGSVVVDNLTCEYEIYGCTNSAAINYNPSATEDDGSCILDAVYGCMDANYLEYNSAATLDTEPVSSCINLIVIGCTDPAASNYNPLANVSDNASCEYNLTLGCTDANYVEYWAYDESTYLLSVPATVATEDDGTCQTLIVFGCVDVDAYNYDVNANVNQTTTQNQTSTCIEKVYGCMDPSMFNYDSEANTEDDSCIEFIYGCMDADYIEFNDLANTDYNPSFCVNLHIEGCTDTTALNYNNEATLDDGSCIDVVYGCMDTQAINYNALANVNDDSCFYESYGCTDVNAANYNSNANTDDGSCYGCTVAYAANFCSTCEIAQNTFCVIEGCTDSNIINYDPEATIDDGSCSPFATEVYGCTDDLYLEYYSYDGVGVYSLNGAATHLGVQVNTDNGTCTTLINTDCTDNDACNYNVLANVDSGECILPVGCDSCTGEQDGTGTVVDNDSDNDGLCDIDDVLTGCTDNTACNYDASATVNTDNSSCTYVDGVCESCEDGLVVGNDIDGDTVCNADEVEGCQDPIADNYNPLATDTGTCIYYGCTDALACNFDASANTDDATCTYVDGVCESCENGLVVDNDQDNDGLCDVDDTIFACTDAVACNYNASETVNSDNDLCTYTDGICDTCVGGVVIDNDLDNDGVCDDNEIVGCQEPEACNYNAAATNPSACEFANAICSTCEDGAVVVYDEDNDGLCDAQDTVFGCTEEDACNYNNSSTVNTDNSICVYTIEDCDTCSGEQDGTGSVVDNDSDNDGLCDAQDTLFGCTDDTACNYNSSTTINTNNSICVYEVADCDACSGEQDGTGVVIDNDQDNDEVCDTDEIIGCQEILADNYNALATDAGDCIYYGCTSAWADNFDSNATDDDGTCILLGCTFTWADNFEPNATDDNGSCILLGCTSAWADNFDPNATDDDGSCSLLGCTSDWADNYDSNATDDDGSCSLLGCTFTWADNWESNATDDDGSCIREGCMVEIMFNYDSLATYDMGGCILVIIGCLDIDADNYSELANTAGTCNYSGCMDSLYHNYDSIANISTECIYYGCTTEGMLNYEEIATHDNGSCIGTVLGCMDPVADNYNDLANIPDYCEYIGCMDSLADNYYDLANVPDDCIFYGCMNESSCNYDEFANTQLSTSCEFPEQYYNCDSTCIMDTDNDGICNQFEIFGCTDPDAENYNLDATEEDGSCYASLQVDVLIVDAVCNGGTGSVQLTLSGGLAPITVVSYTTYQANQTIEVEDAIVTVSDVLPNSETGILTYNMYVYDANGNGDWYPYTIEQPEVLFEMTLDYDEEDSELSFDSNSNTTNFIWTYNGEVINGANNPILTAISNGVYGLYLTDEYGCTLYQEYEVKTIGIEEHDAKALKVYPNPANNFITVESNLFLGEDSEIKLYDLVGNLVLNHKVDNSDFDPQRIDVSGLSEGTYIVSVLNGTKSVYTRIVIH